MTSVVALSDLDGSPHANVFPDAEPRTIRLELAAGDEVAAHSHPGREIVLYVVDGEIDLRLDDESHDLSAGDVARFEGEREISPRAIEASTALVVLAERTDG